MTITILAPLLAAIAAAGGVIYLLLAIREADLTLFERRRTVHKHEAGQNP